MSGGVAAKICGLKTDQAVTAAVDGGAAFIGFVFFPPSPRNIAPATAGNLVRIAAGRAEPVGVVVDPTDDEIEAILVEARVEWLQLHGRETPARVTAIKQRFDIPVIKAIPVAAAADVTRAEDYVGVADRLMFDAKPPKDDIDALPGGNALRFDWTVLAGVDIRLPWALSGGLNAENLAEAVAVTGARMVDVSSGVEDRPGEKNTALIKAFLDIARTL